MAQNKVLNKNLAPIYASSKYRTVIEHLRFDYYSIRCVVSMVVQSVSENISEAFMIPEEM